MHAYSVTGAHAVTMTQRGVCDILTVCGGGGGGNHTDTYTAGGGGSGEEDGDEAYPITVG